MKLGQNHQGFAAVETILVLIVLGLVGFTGWFVYHSKQVTDRTLASNRDSSVTFPQKTATTKASTPKTKNAAVTPTNGYLAVPEWGIKIKVRYSDKITYTLDNTSGELGDAHYDATLEPAFIATYLQDSSCTPGVAMSRSATAEPADAAKTVKVGNYYYSIGGAPGACASDSDNQLKMQFLQDFSLNNVQPL